jgi:hypothetical protein
MTDYVSYTGWILSPRHEPARWIPVEPVAISDMVDGRAHTVDIYRIDNLLYTAACLKNAIDGAHVKWRRNRPVNKSA